MKKIIPIFYACDDNFVKYTLVSLKSMIENASKGHDYRVYILNTGISEKMKDIAYEMQNDDFTIEFVDVKNYLISINDKLPIRDYYSKTTYYRFFIAEMYKEYDKAIYIDSDTVVLGDVFELFSYDLKDNYVGACHEQVMVQVETYGEYVEKVIGIDRNKYFNAGLILINCEQFRKNQVLDRFVDLLHVYTFVVTQDEDYLNLICKDKVLFIDQGWNLEVFGNLPCKEEEIKLLHYIMVSKPWHFDDCRLKEYFWKYAKMTLVYEEILDVLKNYKDEERHNDIASCDRLLELAISETHKEDNYLNLIKKNKLKSSERLNVIKKIAQYEEEGRFDEDVENDPPSKMLMPDQVDYLRKKVSSKIKTKVAFKVARKFLNNIIANKEMIVKDIIGIENIKNLKTGAIITCNHFNAFDSFAIQLVYEKSKQKKRKFFRVIREGNYTNFPGFYGFLMKNCNTLPLSSNYKTLQKFITSTDKLLQDGHFVLVYPEQSMWWNYRKPKPLKDGAYKFATRNNVPVLPCFITMKDSDILGEDGFFIQEYTIHVGEPLYPDVALSRNENITLLKEKNFAYWKKVYEDVYGLPLVYTTKK